MLGLGQDREGELYLLRNETGIPFPDSSGTATGVIHRIAPDAPFVDLAMGKAGASGRVPDLTGQGSLMPGASTTITPSGAPANTTVALVVGFTNQSQTFFGTTLVPAPDLVVPAMTDTQGRQSMTFPWPAATAPGQRALLQYVIVDPGAMGGFSMSNALQLTGQ